MNTSVKRRLAYSISASEFENAAKLKLANNIINTNNQQETNAHLSKGRMAYEPLNVDKQAKINKF